VDAQSFIYNFLKKRIGADMNNDRLFETTLIAVLVAVAAPQMYSVKAANTRDFTLYGSARAYRPQVFC
jgi:hypothetical protein